MSAEIVGPRTMNLVKDEQGHRTYNLVTLIRSEATDGPYTVSNCPGLAAVGSIWTWGGETDPWAFCKPNLRVDPHEQREGDAVLFWRATQTFSTKLDNGRCQDNSITDPLLEPAKVSGSFVKYTKECYLDRFGRKIKNSAHEIYKGAEVEFDANRPVVHVSINAANLNLATFSAMVDCVNDRLLWGLSARKIKLSNVSWERAYQGTCTPYYIKNYDFDIDFNTWDRDLVDSGTMALQGKWSLTSDEWELELLPGGETPDPDNPLHFRRYVDRSGNPCRVVLNGRGMPATRDEPTTGTGSDDDPGIIHVEKYSEANLLLLGIPTTL